MVLLINICVTAQIIRETVRASRGLWCSWELLRSEIAKMYVCSAGAVVETHGIQMPVVSKMIAHAIS